jgi:hypothetical protein
MCVVGLRHLGGALAEPPLAGAVSHREAAYSLNVLSPVQPGQEELVRAVQDEAVAPFAEETLGRSLNFSYGPLTEDQVRSAFSAEAYRRLTETRAVYDPQSMFHSNHVIPPAIRT